jgi:hypothetical protein
MDSTLTDRTVARSLGLDTAPRPTAVVLPTGTVLAGRFTLKSLAGRGGMGAVYRAVDSLTGQPVALKLLLSTAGGETLWRFTREAELLATLLPSGARCWRLGDGAAADSAQQAATSSAGVDVQGVVERALKALAACSPPGVRTGE